MTCREFKSALADIIDDENCRTAEHHEHIESCSACESLVDDLNSISDEARLLPREEEPNARVWQSIEIALRQEGLIREVPAPVITRPARQWRRSAWLAPVAAVLLISVGVVRYENKTNDSPAAAISKQMPVVTVNNDSDDDLALLQTVQHRSPAMLASYEADLKDVNAYIRDARESARTNPNDEEAQRYLMNAYEQKAMVYEMAMDRPLQ